MPVQIMSNVGLASIDIAYQCFGNPSHPPVLLMMGAGAQMIAWPDGFCEELVKQGLYLIRFDNRDTGLSTHFNDAPAPNFAAAMAGDYTSVTYTLSDMAADTIGFVDGLGIDKVHLVGASMGGMIAQTVAIEHPNRVKSLTSIMSTTGGPAVGLPDFKTLSSLGEAPYHEREAYIEWRIRSLKALGSPGFPFDEVTAAKTAGLSWDRDHDPLGMLRQAVAVLKSGDRTEKLHQLKVPTLVLHGTSDKMIDVSGGKATAEAIPGAILHLFEGMGHGLPQAMWTQMAMLIAQHVRNTI